MFGDRPVMIIPVPEIHHRNSWGNYGGGDGGGVFIFALGLLICFIVIFNEIKSKPEESKTPPTTSGSTTTHQSPRENERPSKKIEFKDEPEPEVIEKPQPTPEAQKQVEYLYVVTRPELRVRRAPDVHAPALTMLDLGKIVRFIRYADQTCVTLNNGTESCDYWYLIETPDGTVGWCHGSGLKLMR
jgi:hypothetical protein